ncbi:hypothetical protein [Clostridium sp. ZS2-4]|uniref:hypothetical protein n=1 Tax=Clostridium sp. ZS2-4 TaxID=2987703 RepID=UPI00227A2F52|nr:hypothetical protein [Clostridium sp. ZS2-4]MCY6355798.1 hypothetical protein [Clostridium sp. ZS2-4]
MNKTNSWIEIFVKLIKMIKVFLIKVKLYLNRIYNNLIFVFNKQETIKKMYEPIIGEKISHNKKLQKQLLSLKEDNKLILQEIQQYTVKNSDLNKKVDILQNLILDNTND